MATFKEWVIGPSGPNTTVSIAVGVDGALWFTSFRANQIGKLTPSDEPTDDDVKMYTIPYGDCGPFGIVSAPDNALWITAWLARKIIRLTVNGRFTEYPANVEQPAEIIVGPGLGLDRDLWFTYKNDQVRRMTLGGLTPAVPITYDVPPVGPAAGLAVDADSRLVISQNNGQQGSIGRMSVVPVNGVYVASEFILPVDAGTPKGITVDDRQNVWFTLSSLSGRGFIGRIEPSGDFTPFSSPKLSAELGGITNGPDGARWFTDMGNNSIGRISDDGEIEEFLIPTPDSYPTRITSGPGGALWFTETGANKIGKLVP